MFIIIWFPISIAQIPDANIELISLIEAENFVQLWIIQEMTLSKDDMIRSETIIDGVSY